ncbi:MAG: DMT family transporter [Candidatus Eremiobacteraeota bacterium]|nr:DMT family transporter [Candidatus Eremiobacteraeota bacterium]MBC5828446.1 DMT family transporter [Candidatus Eremiobacteraeota bacterium]
MLGIVLALAAGIVYGAGDFLGGIASRRSSLVSVVVLSQSIGLALLLCVLPFLAPTSPSQTDFVWGGMAGIVGAVGISMLYRGLAIGRMSVVSPVTAVVAAVIPIVFGIVRGERPALAAYAGIGLALLAVVLISSGTQGQHRDGGRSGQSRSLLLEPGLREAFVSGVAIGGFYIILAHVGRAAGLWPLVSYRIVSTALIGLAALLTRRSLRPARAAVGPIIFTGALDIAANALYLEATRRGLLAIVAVLASLYPASTVALAGVVLKERFAPVQVVGMMCAAASIVMIAL